MVTKNDIVQFLVTASKVVIACDVAILLSRKGLKLMLEVSQDRCPSTVSPSTTMMCSLPTVVKRFILYRLRMSENPSRGDSNAMLLHFQVECNHFEFSSAALLLETASKVYL